MHALRAARRDCLRKSPFCEHRAFSGFCDTAGRLSLLSKVSCATSAGSLYFNRFSEAHLSLHEYQSKELLRQFGLNVQRGGVAKTVEEARKIAQELQDTDAKEIVVKAQILAGGRGKGQLSSGMKGGVKVCSTADEATEAAKGMLGHRLVTKQTTAEGEPVEAVLVLEGIDIVKELYLAALLDPSSGGPVFVASNKGGMDIEAVSEEDPNAVKKVAIPPQTSLSRKDCLEIAKALGIDTTSVSYPLNVADQIGRLYDLMLGTDALMVEINPLAVTSKCTDHLMCVDAKLSFDDNAMYRQKRIADMEDTSRIDEKELAARASGLNYIRLDGDIGCLVNGAGLAMATMDVVHLFGGKPANFLDVGGGANTEQVTKAFEIIQSDPKVKVIFVNIFGGIMRCDIIAQGLVAAASRTHLSLPLVVRLVGNQVSEGKRILCNSGVECSLAESLEDAAQLACKFAASA